MLAYDKHDSSLPDPTGAVNELIGRATELLTRATERGVAARMFGGVAVAMVLGERLPEACRRLPGDLDIAAPKGARRELTQVLVEGGFAADRPFNALHGAERMLFEDRDGLKVDVVLERFRMCHVIPLEEAFTTAGRTLPPSLLLLTKLQIFELTEKDRLDAISLLAGCDPAELGVETVGCHCGADWGLWRTVTGSLEAVAAGTPRLTREEHGRLQDNVGELRGAMERAPKSMRWRARARVGDRARWYELPEEP
jgi:hypothetical protein